MATEEEMALVRNRIAEHLNAMATYFEKGIKMTFLARTPDQPTMDFMVTNETDLKEVTDMVERRKVAGVSGETSGDDSLKKGSA